VLTRRRVTFGLALCFGVAGVLALVWSVLTARGVGLVRETRIVPDEYVSIGAALRRIPTGSTVRIRSGSYREAVEVSRSGLTLEALGDGPVWIDGECARDYGIRVRGADDVTIRGISIKRTVGQGILVQELRAPTRLAARITVEGATIQDFNCRDVAEENLAGIAIWYGGAQQQIVGNTITRRVELPGDERGYGDGIWFKSSSEMPSGGGHIITDNVITGGYDGIGGEAESDPRGSFDRDTLIARNRIRACGGDGIQVVGGNVNVLVADNVIEECGTGITLTPNLLGPLTIARNRITSSTPGLRSGPTCFKQTASDAEAGKAYLTDNVCQVNGSQSVGPG
jgi:hypothetical protein